jgi:hypothetical protein
MPKGAAVLRKLSVSLVAVCLLVAGCSKADSDKLPDLSIAQFDTFVAELEALLAPGEDLTRSNLGRGDHVFGFYRSDTFDMKDGWLSMYRTSDYGVVQYVWLASSRDVIAAELDVTQSKGFARTDIVTDGVQQTVVYSKELGENSESEECMVAWTVGNVAVVTEQRQVGCLGLSVDGARGSGPLYNKIDDDDVDHFLADLREYVPQIARYIKAAYDIAIG